MRLLLLNVLFNETSASLYISLLKSPDLFLSEDHMPRTDMKPAKKFDSLLRMVQLPRDSFNLLQADSWRKTPQYGEAELRCSQDARHKDVPKLVVGRFLSPVS